MLTAENIKQMEGRRVRHPVLDVWLTLISPTGTTIAVKVEEWRAYAFITSASDHIVSGWRFIVEDV